MPQATISQSTMVALALFALFLVYITAKGELSQYLAVFFGPVSTTTAAQGSSAGSKATGAVSGALGMAKSVTNLLGGGGSGTNTAPLSAGDVSAVTQDANTFGGTLATSGGQVIGADFGGTS